MNKTATIIQGLAFGDEGKGTMTDHYVRRRNASLVVRYNGGPQAAHNVVLPDGRHHTFSSFGAGTLAGAATHISQFTLVNLQALNREAQFLRDLGVDLTGKLTIDPRAVVITPFHVMTNRAKEEFRAISGQGRHGSVGMGIGDAREDEIGGLALRVGDLVTRDESYNVLRYIQARKLSIPNTEVQADFYEKVRSVVIGLALADMQNVLCSRLFEIRTTDDVLQEHSHVVFEGAQGLLLDEEIGLAPHNSWTNCTFHNAQILLSGHGFQAERVGVLRSYYTRHGAGPFPTEDREVTYQEQHNLTHPYMGGFRRGHFDMVLAKYAAHCIGGIDTLALTHCDRQMYGIKARVGGINPWYPESVEYAEVTGPGAIATELKAANLDISIGQTHLHKFDSCRSAAVGV